MLIDSSNDYDLNKGQSYFNKLVALKKKFELKVFKVYTFLTVKNTKRISLILTKRLTTINNIYETKTTHERC